MKTLSILIAVAFLAGCENTSGTVSGGYYNQDVRREVFFQCLSSVPNGPMSTKYNDWAEVVAECGSQAQYISARGFRDTRAKDQVTADSEVQQ